MLIILLFLAVYLESSHYGCDSLSCGFTDWAKSSTSTDRDKYIQYIKMQTNHSVWSRVYIISIILTLLLYWWFQGTLPPILIFLAFMGMVFLVVYVGFTWYQEHLLRPINDDLVGFIQMACASDDPRNPKEWPYEVTIQG